jgi:hypothetical protein
MAPLPARAGIGPRALAMANIQVTHSAGPNNARSESSVAVNPQNPQQIVSASKKFLSSVHPFRDGNGRVARAGASWIIATCGYGAVRPSSLRGYLYARVADYHGALRENDGGDPVPWRRMFARAVSECLSVPASRASSHWPPGVAHP